MTNNWKLDLIEEVHPHCSCKSAQAYQKNRVTTILCVSVCAKSAQAQENTGVRFSAWSRRTAGAEKRSGADSVLWLVPAEI